MTQTNVLKAETLKLQELSKAQKCPGCELMRNYVSGRYEKLKQRSSIIENLMKTNSRMRVFVPEIDSVKQSLSVIGLYVNV